MAGDENEPFGEGTAVVAHQDSRQEPRRGVMSARVLLIGLAAVLVVGIGLAYWAFSAEDTLRRENLLTQTRMLARTIDPSPLEHLSGSTADLNSPGYLGLKHQLLMTRSANPRCRFMYFLGIRGDEVFFFVDSEPSESKDYSPPGQVYTELPITFRRVLNGGLETVTAPYTDRWGSWISSAVPVTSPTTGRRLGIFCMDVDAHGWAVDDLIHALPPLLGALLCATMLVFFFLYWRHTHEAAEALHRSEWRYRELVEHANSIILHWNCNGHITFLNEFGQRFFGYTQEEILGQHVVGTIVPETESTGRDLRPLMDQICADPRAFEYNINENIRRNGEKVWIAWTNRIELDSQGRVTGILSIGTNITERKRAEEELQFRNTLLATQQEVSIDGILVVDDKARILSYNRRFAEMWGIPAPLLEDSDDEPVLQFVTAQLADPPSFLKRVQYLYEHRHETGQDELLLADGRVFDRYSAPMFGPAELYYGRVWYFSDITERKRSEEALRENEEKYRGIFDESVVAIYTFDSNKRFTNTNQAGLDLLGYSREELLSKRIPDVDADPVVVLPAHEELLSGGRLTNYEHKLRRKDGAIITVLNNSRPLTDPEGRVLGMISTLINITGRKQAEEERAKLQDQLQQAQRMDSVGRLAGGVAHDFNNMLGVILGHTEIALGRVGPADPLHSDLEKIRKAAERSAALTRQLLAFARKQTVTPKVLDLNETVREILKMLIPLIGEDILIKWEPGANVWPLRIDPSQVDQILANLCLNARDAFNDVGEITLRTENVTLDEPYCAAHPDFVPGDYVRLDITDNGNGMDEETRDHVFEPFFTTKGVGEGTGLGLATVYGIVKQNNGFINIRSELGEGTAVTVFLPRYVGKIDQARTESISPATIRGHETILLTEDEPEVLSLTAMMLENQGYTVLKAATPGEAIHLAREYAGDIHLLITDVVMPEMNGRDLAKNVLSLYPHVRRLFMSGYTADVIAHHGILEEGVNFIQKPFSAQQLATKLWEVLGRE